MGVYIPGANTCVRFDQIPPGNMTWPPSCSLGGVYSPLTNQCIPTGTAANPAGQPFDYQINAGGNFGVSTPRVRGNAAGAFMVSGETMSAAPRVNVLLPDFAGGADRTGVNDSSAAIIAAQNAAHNQLLATGVCPVVYLPYGIYNIAQPLNFTTDCAILEGDEKQKSVLKFTNPSAYTSSSNNMLGFVGTGSASSRSWAFTADAHKGDFQIVLNPTSVTGGNTLAANVHNGDFGFLKCQDSINQLFVRVKYVNTATNTVVLSELLPRDYWATIPDQTVFFDLTASNGMVKSTGLRHIRVDATAIQRQTYLTAA